MLSKISSQSIRNDCQRIIGDLREQLWEKLRSDDDPQKLAELIRLLWQLGEPPSQLRAEFFKRAGDCLDTDLAALERQIVLHNQRQMDDCPVSTDVPYDVVEFVDEGCSVFLSDLCLFVTVHDELFIQQAASDFEDTETGEEEALEAPEPAGKVAADLKEFVRRQMTRYFEVVATRMRLEKEGGDNAEIVRALDRFHRRLQAMDRLMAEPSIEEAGLAVVCSVASGRVHFYLEALQRQFEICVAALRRVGSSDAAPGTARAPVVPDASEGGDCGGKTEREEGFEALIQAHITTLVDKVSGFAFSKQNTPCHVVTLLLLCMSRPSVSAESAAGRKNLPTFRCDRVSRHSSRSWPPTSLSRRKRSSDSASARRTSERAWSWPSSAS